MVRNEIYSVRLGEHDLKNDTDGAFPVEYRIKERLMHSFYHSRFFHNDIALLVLDKDVEFREDITPICLPDLNQYVYEKDFAETNPHIAGWGAIRYQGPTSNELQEIQLRVSNLN